MIIYTMKATFLKCQNLMFFLFWNVKKRKRRSHGKRKNGNMKRKICTERRLNTGLSPPVKYFTHGKAVLLLWIFYVFVLSCVCYVFVRVCLYVLCGHLLGKG